jgi:hypothetical protein
MPANFSALNRGGAAATVDAVTIAIKNQPA